MLTADQRSRYARHLLLVEIGEEGQSRLCAAVVGARQSADAAAAAVSADYLRRAGVMVQKASDDALVVDLAGANRVDALAGRPELRDAAATLAGAFAAVEAIKAITGAGQPATLPEDLRLAEDGRRSPSESS